RWGSDAPEAVDLVDVLLAHLGVEDAQSFPGGQAEDAALALVEVLVDVKGGMANLVEGVRPGTGRVDRTLGDEAVGLPRLAVVGEVAGDDPLEVHPQVAVVVLVHVARGRRAGGDGAALAGDEHGGPEGLAARVLEDDVDVLAAGELT